VNRHALVMPLKDSVLHLAAEHLAAQLPRLHAAIRDMEVVEQSFATASIAFDGERIHVGRTPDGATPGKGPLASEGDLEYALAIVAEMIAMEAVERVGGRDARTWNSACMMVAVANLRMSGVFATPVYCAPFDIPMYDGMKPSSLYDRLIELDKAPRQMVGIMTLDDL